MTNLDLAQVLKAAETAASAGRQILMHYFGQLKKVQEKAHAGLVSEADIESEKVITRELQRFFPEIRSRFPSSYSANSAFRSGCR